MRTTLVYIILLVSLSLLGQTPERKFYPEAKFRIASSSTFGEYNLFERINSKLLRVEPNLSFAIQFSFNFQRNDKTTFGLNVEYNSFRETRYYETLSNPNIISTINQHSFIGAGIFYKYCIYQKSRSKFSIVPSVAINANAERELSYFLKISGEFALQYKFHFKAKKHLIINIYHKSALNSFLSNEEYYPFANGVSLGIQF